MFSKLKDKLKDWTKKFVSKQEIEIVETEKKVETKKPEKEIKIKKEIEKIEKKSEEKIEKTKIKIQEEIKIKEEQEKKPEQNFISRAISKLNKVKISEKEFEVYGEELEMLLLENNVALEVAEKIIKELKLRIVGKEFLKKEVEFEIKDTIREIIEEILIEPFDVVEKIKTRDDDKKPFVILFCGINGTGKTTSIAKISELLKQKKVSNILAAADTFRAAAIDQLKEHGKKLDIKVISNEYGSDPASVAFDAIKYAEKNKIDCVLIDTAGRMHTAKNLISQIEKISRVCKPDLKIYVGESTTGNDAIEQIKTFNSAIGIDGIILSKADIDEKGGTALSVGYVTKKPILFLGTGQEYHELEIFDKKKFVEKLGL